jgi:hypothetical protein
MNDLLIPGLTLICGLAGGFAGARGAIVRLETQMEEVRKRLEMHGTKMHRHNDDLLIHDMELETVLAKLDIPRARRQRLE